MFSLLGCAGEGDFSAQDVRFAEMMIPHHEQAIVMSDIALTNTTNPQVLELANQIKDAQAPEIEALRAATGAEFDRLFLEGMIKHHEGAIEMAADVIDSKRAEVAELAKAIIAAQEAEIARMRELLAG